MPYIGRSSNFGVRTRFLYTATASQTTFSGTDTQNLTLSYSDSNFIDVHQNGVLLKVVDDYTATSGTSVVLATGATASDVIEITVYDVFSIANHIKKTGDAMAGTLTNIDIEGTELILDVDGDTSITADTDDQIDIRIGGADDFSFKANTFEVQTGSNIDMNGQELILDADGDTSITSDTDDQVDFKIGGTDRVSIAGANIKVLTGNIQFGASGSETGQIEISSSNLLLRTTGNKSGLRFDTNGYTPFKNGSAADGTVDLGFSSGRFKDLYLGGGIYLGGTGSANELDDYEEGTWTPSLNSSNNSNGVYTKIGRVVTLNAYIGSTDSSTSSAIVITGLPFAVADLLTNTSHEAQGTISYHENSGGNYASAVVVRTGNEIDFRRTDTLAQLQYAHNSGTWSIRFSVTYFTS